MTLEQQIAEIVEKLCKERLDRQAPATDGNALISLEKAARRLDVSESYIRKAIREKRLRSWKVGACVRVRVADVDALAVPAEKPEVIGERRSRALAIARGGRR